MGVPLPSAAKGLFGAAKKSTQINVPPAEDPPVEVQAPPAPPANEDTDTGDPPPSEPAVVAGVGAPTTPIAGVAPPPPPPEEDPVEIQLDESDPSEVEEFQESDVDSGTPLENIQAKMQVGQEEQEKRTREAQALAALRADRKAYLESLGATKIGETGVYRGPRVGIAFSSDEGPKDQGYDISYERAEDDEGQSLFLPTGYDKEGNRVTIEDGIKKAEKKLDAEVIKVGVLDREIKELQDLKDAMVPLLSDLGYGLPKLGYAMGDQTQGDFIGSANLAGFRRLGDPKERYTGLTRTLLDSYASESGFFERHKELLRDHNELNRQLAEKKARRDIVQRRRNDLNTAVTNLKGMYRKIQPQSKSEQ